MKDLPRAGGAHSTLLIGVHRRSSAVNFLPVIDGFVV
jgi:hypothetical protein